MSREIEVDLDLLKEFERLVAEGGSYPCNEVELQPRYNCNSGYHDWKWYVGLHMERYWFCQLCDIKDEARFPPPRS